MYIDTALPINVWDTFIYRVPPHMETNICPGIRVMVPFGKHTRTGIVLSTILPPDDLPKDKIKDIIHIFSDEPLLSSEQLDLAKWISDYYMTPLGECLKLFVPSGSETKSRTRVFLVHLPDYSEMDTLAKKSPNQHALLKILKETGPVSISRLTDPEKTKLKNAYGSLSSLESKGFIRMETKVRMPSARPKYESRVRITESGISFLKCNNACESTNFEKLKKRAPRQALCLKILQNEDLNQGVLLKELIDKFQFDRATLKRLEDKGFVEFFLYPVIRDSIGKLISNFNKNKQISPDDLFPPLTQNQNKAVHLILGEMPDKIFNAHNRMNKQDVFPRPILLYGITGSGKTYIYVTIIKQLLEKGKGAIILVPEIALTPQMVEVFALRFPGHVAVLHSVLSPGERYDTWTRIYKGELDIVIGPRSAIFAPVKNLGVIIVDEEHDGSYKQSEPNPAYHARDTAIIRGRIEKCPVILGSATPSLESYHNAFTGKYLIARIPERIQKIPLPEVYLVDKRKEWEKGNYSLFSFILRDKMNTAIKAGKSVILLINRRGHSPVLVCKNCGTIVECPNCSVSLTYHVRPERMLCHYCGYENPRTSRCPTCSSEELKMTGAGTQRVEKELNRLFPDVRIVRMDHDTTREPLSHFYLLERFRTGESQILLGTQMVAKGLDFPNVSLVGVISADTGLGFPDFRNEERTFQLLCQVAGRSGRHHESGEVIFQSLNPDNNAVILACSHDYESFAQNELEIRKALYYPPYSHLILLIFSGSNKMRVLHSAKEVAKRLKAVKFHTLHLSNKMRVLGPAEAPIFRIKGKVRYQILIKTPPNSSIRRFVEKLVNQFRKRSVKIQIVNDPVHMM